MVHSSDKKNPASPLGVKPAYQGRSRKRRDELISAGMALLCEKNFADISIIELTSACGYSVGTFYSRFSDKDSFFVATQKAAVTEMISIIETEFSDPYWKAASAEEIFRKIVDLMVDALSTDFRGVVRGSIAITASDPSAWIPIHQYGETISRTLLLLLQSKVLEDDPKKSLDSISFAFQMLFGTLMQAILNDPGPVKLASPEMRDNLTRMLICFTQLKKD
ncbi:hypothetical protein A9Q83_12740 [Alphaproteobacteria bacterium 46_93_T64]|nr:hypothetical protein A9Q83_12740 [Alphaproteobacteria bacterium 46_93_T64]